MRLLAALVVVLAVGACVGEANDSIQQDAAKPIAYGSAVDLVDAVRAAGVDCPTPHAPKWTDYAAETLFCGKPMTIDSPEINTYATQADLERSMRRDFPALWDLEGANKGELTNWLLVGPNWIVAGTERQVRTLQPELGGTIVDGSLRVQ
jgi:hypothetical protein